MADEVGFRPRSLRSFGVAGLLAENCEVFYDNLFSTRQLGRVTDLAVARLLGMGGQRVGAELTLRAAALHGVFEAVAAQGGGVDGVLGSPVGVECGTDHGKIALAVSFTPGSARRPRWVGLVDRITTGAPEGEFERALHLVFAHTDRLIIKFQEESGRIEIAAVMALESERQAFGDERSVEVVEVGSPAEKAPPAASYTQLADLDYAALLKEDSPQRYLLTSPTGEVLVKSMSEEEFKQLVSGLEKKNDGSAVVSGSADDLGDELTRVGGLPEIDPDAVSLLSEIELGGLDLALKRLIGESTEIKNTLPKDSKAYRWMDGAMAELMKEKAKLNEIANAMTKKIRENAANYRQKLGELDRIERRLSNDIKARDKIIRHKDISLAQSKELLAQANQALEKAKVQITKPGSGKQGLVQAADTSGLRAQLEKAQKQVEEFKRANQQLLDKLEAKKAEAETGDVEGLRKRLESSMKMLAMARKQSDSLTQQVDALKAQEQKLRTELARVLAELKGRAA